MKNILVPRLMDGANHNPQNSNAKSLISRWAGGGMEFLTCRYGEPDIKIAEQTNVSMSKLWRWRFWRVSLFLQYQRNCDLVFYPGVEPADDLGWRFRDLTGRKVPIVATLEGLVGGSDRAAIYSAWAGHQVNCQHVDEKILARIDRLLNRADHVVAISPFLARMGERLYGEKFSCLPLGVDLTIFYPSGIVKSGRVKVIGAGRLYDNKRPEIFLNLAKLFPEADFIWFGDGELRSQLIEQIAASNLKNVEFPGAISPIELACAFRKADLFVLPSLSEGVPKVSQEAAACGLPVILFGFYEAPSVIHNHNGFVVWDDAELFDAVAQLVCDRNLLATMGNASAEMSKEWDWNMVAQQWLEKVCQFSTAQLN